MALARSAKIPARHVESEEPRTPEQAAADDRVLVASIDSFPASDPPGWIGGKARPREEPALIRRRR